MNISTTCNIWKRLLTRISLVLLIVAHSSLTLLAQPGAGGEAPAAPSSIRSSRSFTFDAIIVVVLVGVALFAVCKAIRRS